MPDHHDHDDGRHVHQKMNMVDQDKDDGEQRREQHKNDETRLHQQQEDRKQTAIDVEMAERMHEILEEERRARDEDQQRQMLFIETEGSLKEPDEQAKRNEPCDAGEREHQPDRHLRREQRNHGADQRALDEAEMVVDQKMDV